MRACSNSARAGARVAVICNLVDHAQGLARRLRGLAGDVPVDLFHARFRFCDRQGREREVMSNYGQSRSSSSGRVLVATQVVEQSLDLDFDWLITQLCPVDLLFQRLGRLHRHERDRPAGLEHPQACVLLPEEPDYGRHGLVYGNLRALWRTRRLLETAAELTFPEIYRDWIERVYDEGDWPDEPAEITTATDIWWGKQCAAREDAQRLVSEFVTPYADEDSRIQFLTRDGEMSLTVLPVQLTAQGNALLDGRLLAELDEWERAEVLNQQAVAVPAGWKSFLPPPEDGVYHVPMTGGAGCWQAELDKVRLVYSEEFGMEKSAAN
jgi:CRISPR-associated endonuclease/helicase Cas3